MPHPLDAHAFPPRGFCQTAAVQTVADQKSLLFIREEKQIVQQQSCPKCIKGVVRRRMRSLTGKLMALPPLLLPLECMQTAVHGAPRNRRKAVSVQTLFGKIALDSVKIADCRNIVILPDLQLLFQKETVDQGVVLSGKAALRFCQGSGNRGLRRRPCFPFFLISAGNRIRREVLPVLHQ